MRETSRPGPEQEQDPEITKQQREIKERLFELDDILAAADDLPHRDSIRSFLSAGVRLAQGEPFADGHDVQKRNVRDRAAEALEPLGFKVSPLDEAK